MNFFTFRLKAVLGLWAQLVGFIFTARARAKGGMSLRIRRQIKELSTNYPNAPSRQETRRQEESLTISTGRSRGLLTMLYV